MDENRTSETELRESETALSESKPKTSETQPQKHEDFRRAGNASRALIFHLMGAGLVLYWLYQIIRDFVKGGPEAPSVGLLIVAILILGGGSIAVALLSYRNYKMDKAAAEMTEEEVAQMEALRAEDEEQDEDSTEA